MIAAAAAAVADDWTVLSNFGKPGAGILKEPSQAQESYLCQQGMARH
jgi:hypothetical protein